MSASQRTQNDMASSQLSARIRKGATEAFRVQSKIDSWLRQNPKQRPRLDEAANVFAEVRSHDFGWRGFASILAGELPDFPSGHQHVKTWFTNNYPELFGYEHREKDS